MSKSPRQLKDSTLLATANEARGYLKSPHLDAAIAEEYRAELAALEGEIRRRDL
jgi:uncharacterized protein YktB (UPF0637 family)